MNSQAWVRRLRDQLPGWFIWFSTPGLTWHAAPAPDGTTLAEARSLPNRIDAATPTELHTAVQLRYGYYDYCESCGVLARECGHRQPEREKKGP